MRWAFVIAFLVASAFAATASAATPRAADRALDRALADLVGTSEGPPGALAVVQRGRRSQLHRAGTMNVETGRPLRRQQRMRIASVSKAFSGATALALASEGVLGLDDTIGDWLPDLPDDWHPVTLRQLLHHTSGVPDFTASPDFPIAVNASPTVAPPPRELLELAGAELDFPPGSEYRYSNSDNIVVALMVEVATGMSYEGALAAKVTGPRHLSRTSMAAGILIPRPFIHGYDSGGAGAGGDVSQEIAFGGWAWASGGILSTPADLNDFARAYVGGRLFDAGTRAEQRQFVPGASEPSGPGRNAAGLALFRYRTACGSMLGHTGSILGYTQLIASNRNGRRSVAFTINAQVTSDLLPELRRSQARAVCAALARR